MRSSKNIVPNISPVGLRLRRIADVLFLNAGFIDNPGLLKGKMGIALFLYKYARNTGSEIYDTYAGELIDEIYQRISKQTPVDFANGLAGIGWGIEYLVRNGFVEADTDEALTEIDNTIDEAWTKRPVLPENNNELISYAIYYLARFWGKISNDNIFNISNNQQQLICLTDEYENLLINRKQKGSNSLFLTPGAINSIIWFLLEMHNLGLVQHKVKKLVNHLFQELIINTQITEDWADRLIRWHLIQNILPMILDSGLKQKWMAIATKPDFVNLHDIPGDETFLNNFASLSWQKLVYSPYMKEDPQLHQIAGKAFKIIDDEENWDQRLDNLNGKNMGLTGLAGLGLGLMNDLI